VGGDGGLAGHQAAPDRDPALHTYFQAPAPDVNFNGNDVLSWDWIGDPLQNSGEKQPPSIVPLIAESGVRGHVSSLACNMSGAPPTTAARKQNWTRNAMNTLAISRLTCGDWTPLGGRAGIDGPEI